MHSAFITGFRRSYPIIDFIIITIFYFFFGVFLIFVSLFAFISFSFINVHYLIFIRVEVRLVNECCKISRQRRT